MFTYLDVYMVTNQHHHQNWGTSFFVSTACSKSPSPCSACTSSLMTSSIRHQQTHSFEVRFLNSLTLSRKHPRDTIDARTSGSVSSSHVNFSQTATAIAPTLPDSFIFDSIPFGSGTPLAFIIHLWLRTCCNYIRCQMKMQFEITLQSSSSLHPPQSFLGGDSGHPEVQNEGLQIDPVSLSPTNYVNYRHQTVTPPSGQYKKKDKRKNAIETHHKKSEQDHPAAPHISPSSIILLTLTTTTHYHCHVAGCYDNKWTTSGRRVGYPDHFWARIMRRAAAGFE